MLLKIVRFQQDPKLNPQSVNKVGGIKAVRALTGLGLKEAKDIVEDAMRTVGKWVDITIGDGLTQQQILALCKNLEENGFPAELIGATSTDPKDLEIFLEVQTKLKDAMVTAMDAKLWRTSRQILDILEDLNP